MRITDLDWRSVLVPVFVAAQALVVYAMTTGEHAPLAPALARFPAAVGQWKVFRQDPIEAAIAKELGADRLVSQTYIDNSTSSFASLLVAWFQTQREGSRQPHSPKVCLPGAGWTPRTTGEIVIHTAAGAINVNRLTMSKNQERAVVLYWYQTPRRVIASEWAAKFWVAADALRDNRTDSALVRVITWEPDGLSDTAATALASRFAGEFYPRLRDYLPR